MSDNAAVHTVESVVFFGKHVNKLLKLWNLYSELLDFRL
jgi:hypothetical protein